jgi:rubredoxin
MAGPTVQLEWAFSWHCPRCRRSFFGTFPEPPLPFDDFLEEHEGEVPPEMGAHESPDTFFMVVPGNVQCPTCGVEYDVKLPRGMDEMEGLDREEYDDF